jgi:hypothetical protein
MIGRWHILIAGLAVAAAAQAAPSAAPMHTSGAKAVYPRLTQFSDAKIMAAVNAALAAQETADRQAYADCLQQIKDAGQKPDADSYSADISISYLSPHYMSVNVVSSYDCAGAYPNAGIETPLTFDLRTGHAVDWTKMFKPGFLPDGSDKLPGIALLYRARYRFEKGDEDCRDAIMHDDPFSDAPIIWLDAQKGLEMQPDFAHVDAACARLMSLSGAEVAPYLRDPGLAADLKAVVPPFNGKRELE